MFFTGYFKKISERMDEDTQEKFIELAIPNLEVKYIFRTKILKWFNERIKLCDRTKLFNAVVNENPEVFEVELNNLLLDTISFNDAYENFYHGFLTGVFSNMKGYIVKSNREGGSGRSDLFITNSNEPINIADLKKPIVPDLFIVCDSKFELVGNNIVCIPDFICEIVSPSSIKMDNEIKKELYLSKGVKEYWVVNYLEKTIKVYFDNKENIFSFEDQVKVNIFNDLTLCLNEIELFEV